jgi:hypothetical protein
MQSLPHSGQEALGRVLGFVPRWIPHGVSICGMPYKVFPILSSLAKHGLAVDLFTEVHDDLDGEAMARALRGCDGAFVWCPEMNPGTQVAGMLRFLDVARRGAPTAPLVAGGAFFYLLPPAMRRFADAQVHVLDDSGIPSLARFFRRVLADRGRAPPLGAEACVRPRDMLDPDALYRLDLTPFLRPEGMIFGNDQPTLQVPTGLGCAKACAFCFYERTKVAMLPAEPLVELIVFVRQRYDVRQILMGELDFFANRRRVLTMAAALRERRVDVRWFALASIGDVDALSEPELDLVAASGCHALELGTEVGSPEALARIGKRYGNEGPLRVSERLLARGIVPIHNIMLGFVGEEPRHRRQTLSLVRRLRRLGRRVRFNFRIYQAAPNTTMGDDGLRFLPQLPATIDGLVDYRAAQADGRALPWLTAAAERDVRRFADWLLPLAFDDALVDGRPSWRRRLLRRLADLRCRLAFSRCPIDHWLLRRFETVGLPGTFLA